MNYLILRTRDFTPEQYQAVYETLSASRKAHIDTFRHGLTRQQSLAGELALRQLLAREGIDAVPIRLSSGQPALDGSDLYVSITHCDDLVACALDERPIGIDAERIKSVKPGMAQRICTARELAYVADSEERFFEIWTAKEAWFKMQGTGITDFQAVDTLALPRKLIRREDYLIQVVYTPKR